MNAARARISRYGWIMIFMLLALGAINLADKAVLGLAALPIIKELHLSPTQYGLVSGSFFLLFALSSVVVTAWSDRIGTKTVLALLATSWAVVQIATVFVFSFPALLLTRVLLGAGEGPSYGTSVSAATPWLPNGRRAFGLGVVSFGSAIGPALFAPLLTFLIVVVGWRSAYALLGGTVYSGRSSGCWSGESIQQPGACPYLQRSWSRAGHAGQRYFQFFSRAPCSSQSWLRSSRTGLLRYI